MLVSLEVRQKLQHIQRILQLPFRQGLRRSRTMLGAWMMRIGRIAQMIIAAITSESPVFAILQKRTQSTASPPKMPAAFAAEEPKSRAHRQPRRRRDSLLLQPSIQQKLQVQQSQPHILRGIQHHQIVRILQDGVAGMFIGTLGAKNMFLLLHTIALISPLTVTG